MPRVSADVPGRVFACPNCDGAGDIYRREFSDDPRVNRPTAGDPEAPYHCGQCSATFYRPVCRKAKPDPTVARETAEHRSGVSRRLVDMDPEDAGLKAVGER